MKKTTPWTWTPGLALIVGAFAAPTVHGSGFRIPEVSLSGLGEANAQVADDKEIGALAYNPAAMSYHAGRSATAGLVAIVPTLSVATATGTHDSENRSPVYVPNLYVMGPIAEPLTLGLAINAPFGLETRWPSGTFPAFSGPLAAAAPTLSKLEMVNVNPNVAFRTGDMSFAVGLDYYNVIDVALNTPALDMSGDGGDVGYNLAFMDVAGPLTFGASYRSAIDVDIEGTAVQSGVPRDAQTTLKLPWMFQIGARYRFNEALGLEFDVERTGWSQFDSIVITRAGAPTIASSNDWKDANAYRLGGAYDLSPQRQLRFGYTYDRTGQPDARFNARIPDADRHLFSIGVKQQLAGWALEAGYMYVKFVERTVMGGPYTPGGEPNGTIAYAGTYNASAHLVGLGLSRAF